MAKVDLSDWRTQKRFLTYLRVMGEYKRTAKKIGVHPKTVERYREKDIDFNERCEIARANYQLRKKLETGVELKAKAYRNLDRKLDQDQVKSHTLVKILETSFDV